MTPADHAPGRDHDHHGHAQGASHDHHHAPPENWDSRYAIGIALNLAFVAIEGAAGILANSTALLADAGHNLSDVLGLALAGGAAWLANRAGSQQRTYGFGKATVLAALANALLLVLACGAIGWEAIRRLSAPPEVATGIVIFTAAAGVLVNGATAMLFFNGRKGDINARGAFLHMAADAGVSAGVIIAGLVIAATGWALIDPLISVAIVALILASTLGLLRESLDLAMDRAPDHIDVAKVREMLLTQDGVTEVHDLHVWAMSTTQTALTVHIVRPDGAGDAVTQSICRALHDQFGISHVTVQVERAAEAYCPSH
jgi:cobalt-zinc-cadmium efflux system protein